MANREAMTATILNAYQARARGDLKETLAAFHPDAKFQINGAGTNVPMMMSPSLGVSAIEASLQALIENYRFENWRQEELIFENETAFLCWTADVTCIPTGKSARFTVFDLFKFRDGKILELRQSTCTAQILTISS